MILPATVDAFPTGAAPTVIDPALEALLNITPESAAMAAGRNRFNIVFARIFHCVDSNSLSRKFVDDIFNPS